MQVVFNCTHCDTQIEADSSLGGSEQACPKCGNGVVVPSVSIGPGFELGGFKILRKLGSGGMGDVFLADQLSLGRFVALKVLHPKLTQNKTTIERFMHEIKMLAKLNHPTIVTAFEAGQQGSHYYFAMSYVDGKSLKEILKEDGPLSEKYALEIIEKLAEALDFALEKHQILHRDIKPENIMIDNDGSVRLLDLGIGKDLEDEERLTLTDAFLGTPDYASPEQAANPSEIDCRSDIYALGTTFYHLLTGEPPYRGKNLIQLLTMHRKAAVPKVSERNPVLSAECNRLIAWMMAKRPDARPKNWHQLIGIVDAMRSEHTAQPISELPELARTGAYLPRLTVLIPGLVVLMAILALLKTGIDRQKEQRQQKTDSAVELELIPRHENTPAPSAAEEPESSTPDAESDRTPHTLLADEDTDKIHSDQKPAPNTQEIVPVKKRIFDLENRLKNSPESFHEILRELNGLKNYARNQSETNAIKLAIAEVLMRRKETADQAFRDLDRHATRIFEEGETERAIELLKNYTGPCRQETAIRRHSRAATIKREVEKRQAEEEKLRLSREELGNLLEEILVDLLQGKPAVSAVRSLTTAEDNPRLEPVAEKLEEATETVRHLLDKNRLVLESFREDIDHEIPVALKRGKADLTVIRIDGNEIHALKQEKYGKMKIILTVDDLSVMEVLKRLPPGESSEATFLRGLTAVLGGLKSTGMNELSRLEGPLGKAFEDLRRKKERANE